MNTITLPKKEYEQMKKEIATLRNTKLYKRLLEFQQNIKKQKFTREVIRDKVKALERNKAILEMYGKSKRKTTDEELHKAGEAAVKELEEKFK